MVYETNSNNLIIENTSDGYIENIKLEGKTLVNLWGNKASDFFLSGQATFNEETGYVELTSTSHRYSNVFTKYTGNLKPNTLYTIIVDVVENTFAKSDIPILKISSSDPTQGYSCFNETRNVNGGRTGKFVFTITTISDFSNVNIGLRTFVDNINSEVGCKLKFRIIILEGDHTQNPPNYFEGLKSVGEDVDKISILSIKGDGNLANMYGGYTIPNVDIFTNGGSLTYNATNSYHRYKFKRVNFIEGEKYTVVLKGNNCRLLYNNGVLSSTNVVTNGIKYKTFIAQKGSYCESLENSNLGACTVRIDGIWIYKGEYDERKHIPYKEHKKELYKDVDGIWKKPVLREWDSIEKHADGKYYYHKRSEEMVLNGSENWTLRTDRELENSVVLQLNNIIPKYAVDNVNIITDKFNSTTSILTDEAEGIYLTKDSTALLRVNKSKLTTQDVQGFKQWLQGNNVTVVYQLAQEEVYECLPIPVASYKGETTYRIEGGVIAPTSSFALDYSLSNAVNRISDVKVFNNAMKDNLKTHINKIREVL